MAATSAAPASIADDRVVVVTGGAQGIGFGIARRFATKGCSLVLIDMNPEKLAEAKAELEGLGAKVMANTMNVTKEEEWKACIDEVISTFGGVDVLVQSAGITGATKINTEDVDPKNFELVMAVNCTGVFLGCRAVLGHMAAKGSGRVINIASVAGKEGNAGMLAYSTSKAAVIGMTKVMGKEYATTGVTVNAVAPAVVQTAMVDAMPAEQVKYMTDKIPMRRTGTIDEIATLVEFIASPGASFTTGFTFDATGGRATY